MDHLKLGRSSKKKELGKRRGLAIIYDGFNLVGNRIDIRDFRSRNPLQGCRKLGHNHPPHNILKFLFLEGHTILQNLHLTFDWHYIGQKQGEDFAKFCGLLRIYELLKKFLRNISWKDRYMKDRLLLRKDFTPWCCTLVRSLLIL